MKGAKNYKLKRNWKEKERKSNQNYFSKTEDTKE